MRAGKKSVAESIVDGAFEIIEGKPRIPFSISSRPSTM